MTGVQSGVEEHRLYQPCKNPSLSPSRFTVWGQGTEREKAKGDEGWDVGESSDQFLGCESRRFIGV